MSGQLSHKVTIPVQASLKPRAPGATGCQRAQARPEPQSQASRRPCGQHRVVSECGPLDTTRTNTRQSRPRCL